MEDVKRLEKSKEFSWEIDWLIVDDGKFDLRKALVKCNE